MSIIGLDVGGANLKIADDQGHSESRAFALWRSPQQLPRALIDLLANLEAVDEIRATMTGELCDCFSNREHGVTTIVEALTEAAETLGLPAPRFWSTAGCFVNGDEAKRNSIRVGASNWHALANWVAQEEPRGSGLLIDIGTTTSDIIPVHDGRVMARGLTDTERLIEGELVYTGAERTPLCSLADYVPLGQHRVRIASELFATTLDVYLILGLVNENPDDVNTADGRARTKASAARRLAKMLCADADDLGESELCSVARSFAASQTSALQEALKQVAGRLGRIDWVVTSGSGEFLARKLLPAEARQISIADRWGAGVATAACAHSLTRLGG